MSRLTRKEYKNLVYGTGYYNKKNCQRFTEVYHKLGCFEDLEDELGCPLEVVFRALTDGIIINEEGYVNSAYDNEEFNEEDSYYNCLKLYKSYDGYYFEDIYPPYGDAECGGIGCWVKLSDYQKTWWLRGEKDEKED